MAKIFNNIQELWSHCLFCPMCQNVSRKIFITVHPDEVFELKSFEKDNQFLILHCLIRLMNKRHQSIFTINCLDNTFQFDIYNTSQSKMPVEKASSPTFCMCIQARCHKCDNASIYSEDIELDLLKGLINNIKIEYESIYVSDGINEYFIQIWHNRNNMLIGRCFEDDNGSWIDEENAVHLPIVAFDFSNTAKIINKIKILLLFS